VPFFAGVHLGTVSLEVGIQMLISVTHFHGEAMSWA